MLTETITFHEITERLPDADLIVLARIRNADEPLWLASWDGEQWHDTEGMPVEVVRWAELPAGGEA